MKTRTLTLARKNNVFAEYLNYLGVKYTDEYANKLYNEHPHKYNLLGLSKMLSDYNIENAGIKIADKAEAIHELEAPFIAHIGSDFVVVYKITAEKVYYIWNKKDHSTSIEEFLRMWSGVVLYAEPDENSMEPAYKANHRKEQFTWAQKIILLASVFLLLIVTFFKNGIYGSPEYYLLAAVNLCGVYAGYLLVLKQMHILRIKSVLYSAIVIATMYWNPMRPSWEASSVGAK